MDIEVGWDINLKKEYDSGGAVLEDVGLLLVNFERWTQGDIEGLRPDTNY